MSNFEIDPALAEAVAEARRIGDDMDQIAAVLAHVEADYLAACNVIVELVIGGRP